MSLETDLLIDRRRLKRRLVFWRLFGVTVLLVAILLAVGTPGVVYQGAHVTRVTVAGLITEDRKLTDAIDALADNSSVKAVILSVNSPGGSVAGGEALHTAIERLASHKPVVTVMGALAASAGYMIAVPTSRIFARDATLTGSIGVLLQTGEVSGLLDKVGVTAEVVRSGPLKDEPSLSHALSPSGRAVLQGIVDDMYRQFVSMVARGRHIPIDRVQELADGRAYTGRQALGLSLIDAIGGEREARHWLATEKGVDESLPIEELPSSSYTAKVFSGSLRGVFLDILSVLGAKSVSLDGPLALWQPNQR